MRDQPFARTIPTHKTLQNKRTHIHASSGFRNHDPSVRAGEDDSCLRPRGHWDWLMIYSDVSKCTQRQRLNGKLIYAISRTSTSKLIKESCDCRTVMKCASDYERILVLKFRDLGDSWAIYRCGSKEIISHQVQSFA
jgi:hypothetical protein